PIPPPIPPPEALVGSTVGIVDPTGLPGFTEGTVVPGIPPAMPPPRLDPRPAVVLPLHAEGALTGRHVAGRCHLGAGRRNRPDHAAHRNALALHLGAVKRQRQDGNALLL